MGAVVPERAERANGETTTLRETWARLEAIRELMDERDRRYGERFDAQEKATVAALSAQDKQTISTFMASEKAISKAEQAQTAYNERSNEFRQALDDQAKMMMSRSETETRFNAQEEKIEFSRKEIAGLRESRSGVMGKDVQANVNTQQNQWAVGTAIAVCGTLVGLIGLVASVVIVLAGK